VIGVREEGGVAVELRPISVPTATKLKLRLESLLQTAIAPRIFGIQMRPVGLRMGMLWSSEFPRSPAVRIELQRKTRIVLAAKLGRRLRGEHG